MWYKCGPLYISQHNFQSLQIFFLGILAIILRILDFSKASGHFVYMF